MTSNAEGATPDLLRALTDDLSTLIRSELKRVQDELADTARRAGRGGALLAGAGVLATLSAGTSAVLLVRVLDRFLPPRASVLVATALYGGGAAALAVVGWREIRRSLASAPGDVLTDVREDAQAVLDGASDGPAVS